MASLFTSCRVWDLDGNETVSFRLWSPGVTVCWHPEEVFKVSPSTASAPQFRLKMFSMESTHGLGLDTNHFLEIEIRSLEKC